METSKLGILCTHWHKAAVVKNISTWGKKEICTLLDLEVFVPVLNIISPRNLTLLMEY